MATIEVTLDVKPDGVEVTSVTANGLELGVKNPQAAAHGDTVTWTFPSDPKDLKVVFKGVQFPKKSGGLGSSQHVNAPDPFSAPLSRIGNKIRGTIDPDARKGRYLYDIRDGNDQRLNWLTLLEGQNFGGLDVPRTPPK